VIRPLSLVGAVLASLVLAPPASAADGKDDRAAGLRKLLEGFPALDADGDGRLSAAEFPDADVLAALDADKDGFLTRAEIGRSLKMSESGRKPLEGDAFTAWAKERVAVDPRFNAEARRTQFLENFDRDPKDGKIQRKEYAGADGDRVFRDFDREKDGALDAKEILALMKDQLVDLEKSRRRPNRGNFLVLFDLDDDRRVTRDEYAFLRGPASTFNSYDEDEDGIVSYEELIYMKAGKDRRNRGKDGAPAAQAPPPEKHDVWELYDKDKDGRVTAEEFGGGEAVFRRLDRNRDGSLTSADV